MQSNARDVDEYIEGAPTERQAALSKFQALCRQLLGGFKESMVYGMPCYSRNGVVEIAFASQMNFISLYILQQKALESQRSALAGLKVGKGCIRYPKPDNIDFEVVEKLLLATYDLNGRIN